jgi:hypothetical protein
MTDLAMALQRLRLPHGAAAVSKLWEGARREEWSDEELLTRLVETELFGREQQRIERRIKAARFPVLKTLEEFDFTFQTSIKKQVLLHLAGLDFVREHSNVILIGPPGTGKPQPTDCPYLHNVSTAGDGDDYRSTAPPLRSDAPFDRHYQQARPGTLLYRLA